MTKLRNPTHTPAASGGGILMYATQVITVQPGALAMAGFAFIQDLLKDQQQGLTSGIHTQRDWGDPDVPS